MTHLSVPGQKCPPCYTTLSSKRRGQPPSKLHPGCLKCLGENSVVSVKRLWGIMISSILERRECKKKGENNSLFHGGVTSSGKALAQEWLWVFKGQIKNLTFFISNRLALLQGWRLTFFTRIYLVKLVPPQSPVGLPHIFLLLLPLPILQCDVH